eukprot:982212-Prorocentrum_minimum.AAC.1
MCTSAARVMPACGERIQDPHLPGNVRIYKKPTAAPRTRSLATWDVRDFWSLGRSRTSCRSAQRAAPPPPPASALPPTNIASTCRPGLLSRPSLSIIQ